MENLNENYSKDKLNIYFDWKVIKWVDLKSFKVISDIFAKDKMNIFWWEEKINEIDSKTFQILDDFYLKDKENIFYISQFDSIIKVEWADINSFKTIKGISKSGIDFRYAKDKKYIYHSWTKIHNSDSKTFQFINECYSKDKNNVYVIDLDIYNLDIIKGVDPDTFELLQYHYSKDKNKVFYSDCFWIVKTLNIVDSNTVKVINSEYFKDKNNTYYIWTWTLWELKIVDWINIKNFKSKKENDLHKDKQKSNTDKIEVTNKNAILFYLFVGFIFLTLYNYIHYLDSLGWLWWYLFLGSILLYFYVWYLFHKYLEKILLNKIKILLLINTFLIIIAFFDNPYSYYPFMRSILFWFTWYITYLLFKDLEYKILEEKTKNIFIWLLGIITILYNPFWIIHLWRELWEIINIITIIIYLTFIYNIKK